VALPLHGPPPLLSPFPIRHGFDSSPNQEGTPLWAQQPPLYQTDPRCSSPLPAPLPPARLVPQRARGGVSLQVVDLSAMEDPMEHLETVFYQRDLLSFINVTEVLSEVTEGGGSRDADLAPLVSTYTEPISSRPHNREP